MSRSYRISVRESCSRVIRAEDRVSTQLEILEVLPPEQMAGLLADGAGRSTASSEDGDTMVRQEDGVNDHRRPEHGHRDGRGRGAEATKVDGERDGRAYDDVGPHAGQVREQLRKELQKNLEKKVAGQDR